MSAITRAEVAHLARLARLDLAEDELDHYAEQLDVNEQNPQAVGFYFKQGFEVIGRSEVDGMGQPYPLLHMRLRQNQQRTSNG